MLFFQRNWNDETSFENAFREKENGREKYQNGGRKTKKVALLIE